jgi:hypothetical protein
MTALEMKTERKWLDRSIRADAEQDRIRITHAAEATNHARVAREMPEPKRSEPKRLDGSADQWHGDHVTFYLGNVGEKTSLGII